MRKEKEEKKFLKEFYTYKDTRHWRGFDQGKRVAEA